MEESMQPAGNFFIALVSFKFRTSHEKRKTCRNVLCAYSLLSRKVARERLQLVWDIMRTMQIANGTNERLKVIKKGANLYFTVFDVL